MEDANDKGNEEVDEGVTEKDQVTADPFTDLEDIEDPALLYVIEKWGLIGDDLVIEGKVTAMTATWELKRGDYNSETVRGHVRMEPSNLNADIIVRKPVPEIVVTDSNLGIVGQVFNRLGRELSVSIYDVMVQHMEMLHVVKPGDDKPGSGVTVIARKGGASPTKTAEVL